MECLTHYPNIRQAGRQTQIPERFGDTVAMPMATQKTPVALEEPHTYTEAIGRADGNRSIEAMKEEILSIKQISVWSLADLPNETEAIATKWMYQLKRKADGLVDRYKARLVAKGFSQKLGTDCGEICAPVIKYKTLRMLLAKIAQQGLKLLQLDV